MLQSAAVVGKLPAGLPSVDALVGPCGHAGGNRQVAVADLGGRRSKVGAEAPAQPQTGSVLGGTVRPANQNPFLF